jgi:hypothetical protein
MHTRIELGLNELQKCIEMQTVCFQIHEVNSRCLQRLQHVQSTKPAKLADISAARPLQNWCYLGVLVPTSMMCATMVSSFRNLLCVLLRNNNSCGTNDLHTRISCVPTFLYKGSLLTSHSLILAPHRQLTITLITLLGWRRTLDLLLLFTLASAHTGDKPQQLFSELYARCPIFPTLYVRSFPRLANAMHSRCTGRKSRQCLSYQPLSPRPCK